MIQIITFLVLAVLGIVSVTKVCILAIYYISMKIRQKANPEHLLRLKRATTGFAVLVILNAGLVAFSQITASTPSITDEKGSTPENSMAELKKIELNGRNQWSSIRDFDKNNPVLLFLAGGPSGTQMAAVRHELSELEKHFVVINWDQPGSGKSYYAEKTKNISVDTYIKDGYALTKYLKERFSQEKIYLIGESWGSALGIFLIDKYPESYHGFIGTAQMIDFAETKRMDYRKVMEIAGAKGDTAIIEQLKKNGLPPTTEKM